MTEVLRHVAGRLSRREFRRTIGDGGGRGRASARDTFGCGFVLRGLVQGSCVTSWGGSLGGSFGGRLGTVGGGAAPVHGSPFV